MCGSETDLYKAEIEGTVLNVCTKCAKFGKVVAKVPDKRYLEKIQKKREKTPNRTRSISSSEITENLVENFYEIIKNKREKLGLKQEDFAKKINEKASIIHKIETGHFEPNLSLSRKIEKFLKISIVEQIANESSVLEKTKSESFTLGDFIKVRR
ncbi:MAG: TIGR00270 family protein [Nanoarchaeota archaeon]|nr:TIGR00270 family protein [Nanoarchaeota archaeon]